MGSMLTAGKGGADEPEGTSRKQLIDAHVHILLPSSEPTQESFTGATLLQWMDVHDVEQAVVLGVTLADPLDERLTKYILAQTKPNRERMHPFCVVDPASAERLGHEKLVEWLVEYKEAGARGFGEHKPEGVAIDDPRCMMLYRACAIAGFPVLFHLDGDAGIDRPGLPGLTRVLEAHPDTTFIAHGPGWWASISKDTPNGDLNARPMGRVVPGGAVDRLLGRFSNLHADLSAGSGANAITRDIEFGREFLIRHADRLMFGTDAVGPGQSVPHFELYGEIDLPDRVKRKILHENARALLELG